MMHRIEGVILFFKQAKNAAQAKPFNAVKGEKNESKCMGYFIKSPKSIRDFGKYKLRWHPDRIFCNLHHKI